ncbi:MAG: pyridoxamine 5'-phosphate oxidase family protein [Candidatus Rokubacteria bacterium]|nr:pyridoxamine 5'-phosphate oxidase family protein [Candidatus Rokubacteria bacterium]
MAGPFRDVVGSEQELRALIGSPSELAVKKQLAALDAHARAFIARSPFLLMATASGAGRCDVSPKGDGPGFVLVLDERHLVVPDRPGNRRLDGMRNILENPHVGLIFLVPGKDETLRVNGRASIVRDAELLARMEVGGKRPQLGIGVEVEECFFHCPKAFLRSKLWKPEHWPDRTDLPSMARIMYDQAKPAGETLEQLTARLEEGDRKTLY